MAMPPGDTVGAAEECRRAGAATPEAPPPEPVRETPRRPGPIASLLSGLGGLSLGRRLRAAGRRRQHRDRDPALLCLLLGCPRTGQHPEPYPVDPRQLDSLLHEVALHGGRPALAQLNVVVACADRIRVALHV